MDPNAYVNVDFSNITWEKFDEPDKYSHHVRLYFLIDDNGKWLDKSDTKAVLKSWLHDEFGVCPLDFDFQIVP